MSADDVPAWYVGDLPFHVGVSEIPTNAPLPELMPMRVGVDRASGSLVQIPEAAVMAGLDLAYAEGSQIGTPLSSAGLGRPALDDVVAFITEARQGRSPEGARVLEIGCGTGALLARLKEAGAQALGVEPGARAAEQACAAGLEVITSPFERDAFPDGAFDLIVHHAVLEHVPEPVSFLRDQLSLLTDDGVIVCSVPDCSLPMSTGDLSMLVHEHLSYFTPESLRRTGALAGARTVAERASRSAGATYCAWAVGATDVHTAAAADHSARDFMRAGPRSLEAVHAFAERMQRQGRTLGVFCPARFINYQALTPVLPRLRYFDDDPLLEGRYYPPFDVRVEARAGLLAEPVDDVLVMSWTFGEHIARDLRSRPELAATTIHTVAELLGELGGGASRSRLERGPTS
jgi:SAM-dependent methyltransferase